MADDDLMALWNATRNTAVCTCLICRNLGVHELENEYNWDWAERSLTRTEWMLDDDGLAPLYMERQRVRREEEERQIRSKLWLTKKRWWIRAWRWVRHGEF